MPKVYNKYHKDAPEGVIYIGRPSKWGNQFSHMNGTLAQFKTTTREEAVAKYEQWLLGQPELISVVKLELTGKDLLCFCAPKSCHGDVLLRIANE